MGREEEREGMPRRSVCLQDRFFCGWGSRKPGAGRDGDAGEMTKKSPRLTLNPKNLTLTAHFELLTINFALIQGCLKFQAEIIPIEPDPGNAGVGM